MKHNHFSHEARIASSGTFSLQNIWTKQHVNVKLALPNVQTLARKSFIHNGFTVVYSRFKLVFVWKSVNCVFQLQPQQHHPMRTVFCSSEVLVSCKMIYSDPLVCFVIYFLPMHQMLTSCQKCLASYLLCWTMATVIVAGDLKWMWFRGHPASLPSRSCGHALALHASFVWVKSQYGEQSKHVLWVFNAWNRIFKAAVNFRMHVSEAFWGTVGLNISIKNFQLAT